MFGRLLTILAHGVLALSLPGAAGVAWAQSSPAKSAPTPTLSAAPSSQDRILLEMRDAFAKKDSRTLTSLLPRVAGHPLEPLAAYWELATRLDTASHQEIRSFLQRNAGNYYEDRLRNDWLLLLGKNGDYDTFSAELPLFRMNDDRQVQCHALLVEYRRTGRNVAAEVAERWLAQRDADDGCTAAAKAMIDAGLMPEHVAWVKARLGMENNRPRAAAQAVGLLNPEWEAIVSRLHGSPAQYLDEKITAIRPRTKEFVTLALVRLATADPEAAVPHVSKTRWQAQLTEEELGYVWGVIGKRRAQRLNDTAMEAFERTDTRHLESDHLVWKARAALRAGQWAALERAVAAMPAAQQNDPTWVYWRARALQARNQPATALFEQIADTRGFYEQLALEALGLPVKPPAAPPAPTEAERQLVLQNAGLQRALTAFEIGLTTPAIREWTYEVALHTPGGLPDRELLAAAELACAREAWILCINTSKRTRDVVDMAQRFPMPFKDAVVQRSREIGLDPAYVYGLIRQESRFLINARSHVGASGLMQVMPATAQWTARRIGLTNFQPHQINERDTNIAIGTAYLKLALDDFEGSLPMAAAAYNAGPGRPRNWRNGPVLEAAIWIENIPFQETRDYVKKVLANTTNYAAILTGQPQRLSSRLGEVGPRPATARAPNTDLP